MRSFLLWASALTVGALPYDQYLPPSKGQAPDDLQPLPSHLHVVAVSKGQQNPNKIGPPFWWNTPSNPFLEFGCIEGQPGCVGMGPFVGGGGASLPPIPGVYEIIEVPANYKPAGPPNRRRRPGSQKKKQKYRPQRPGQRPLTPAVPGGHHQPHHPSSHTGAQPGPFPGSAGPAGLPSGPQTPFLGSSGPFVLPSGPQTPFPGSAGPAGLPSGPQTPFLGSAGPVGLPSGPQTPLGIPPKDLPQTIGPMGMCEAWHACIHWQLCRRDGFIISDGSGKINKRIKKVPPYISQNLEHCGGDMYCCKIPLQGSPLLNSLLKASGQEPSGASPQVGPLSSHQGAPIHPTHHQSAPGHHHSLSSPSHSSVGQPSLEQGAPTQEFPGLPHSSLPQTPGSQLTHSASLPSIPQTLTAQHHSLSSPAKPNDAYGPNQQVVPGSPEFDVSAPQPHSPSSPSGPPPVKPSDAHGPNQQVSPGSPEFDLSAPQPHSPSSPSGPSVKPSDAYGPNQQVAPASPEFDISAPQPDSPLSPSGPSVKPTHAYGPDQNAPHMGAVSPSAPLPSQPETPAVDSLFHSSIVPETHPHSPQSYQHSLPGVSSFQPDSHSLSALPPIEGTHLQTVPESHTGVIIPADEAPLGAPHVDVVIEEIRPSSGPVSPEIVVVIPDHHGAGQGFGPGGLPSGPKGPIEPSLLEPHGADFRGPQQIPGGSPIEPDGPVLKPEGPLGPSQYQEELQPVIILEDQPIPFDLPVEEPGVIVIEQNPIYFPGDAGPQRFSGPSSSIPSGLPVPDSGFNAGETQPSQSNAGLGSVKPYGQDISPTGISPNNQAASPHFHQAPIQEAYPNSPSLSHSFSLSGGQTPVSPPFDLQTGGGPGAVDSSGPPASQQIPSQDKYSNQFGTPSNQALPADSGFTVPHSDTDYRVVPFHALSVPPNAGDASPLSPQAPSDNRYSNPIDHSANLGREPSQQLVPDSLSGQAAPTGDQAPGSIVPGILINPSGPVNQGGLLADPAGPGSSPFPELPFNIDLISDADLQQLPAVPYTGQEGVVRLQTGSLALVAPTAGTQPAPTRAASPPAANQGMGGGMSMMMLTTFLGTPLMGNTCSASMFCVQPQECDLYRGFIILDPMQVPAVIEGQQQVPTLKCRVPVTGKIQNGICCALPHPLIGPNGKPID